MTPLVTVGLPFYNAASTLDMAIRSVVAQTLTDWELLLFDDGSTDGSLAIARSFIDPRIRVLADGV
ncbi:MAG: glycosyltransferase, partial [Bacteroidetes bacterium]|nr:glycosyltransferase [Fibrella sp.]